MTSEQSCLMAEMKAVKSRPGSGWRDESAALSLNTVAGLRVMLNATLGSVCVERCNSPLFSQMSYSAFLIFICSESKEDLSFQPLTCKKCCLSSATVDGEMEAYPLDDIGKGWTRICKLWMCVGVIKGERGRKDELHVVLVS